MKLFSPIRKNHPSGKAMDDKGSVLVVDDTSQNLELLSSILSGDGFEVRPAKSGRLALESARAIPPDLILLDVLIPDMDGYEVCRRLKADERTREVPVIFISALEESVDRVQGFEVGGVDFVSKPFRAEEVLARVRTHMTLRKTQLNLEIQKAHLEREIAERKKAERALQESEERMQSILDNAPAVIYVKDTQGRYTLINRTFEELFHVGRDYFIGRTDHDVFPKEVADTLHENDLEVFESGQALQAEEVVLHDDGPHSYISVKFPLRDVRGQTYALCGISSDITERKRAEVALQDAKEAAETANRAKSFFLANMSHELRTPLNVILGFSQLMQRDPALSPSSQKHLETINRSGEHLLALINDVLEVSKIEAGCINLNQVHFDLFGLLEDIEAMFRMRAEQKGLRFRIEKKRNLPRFLVGDRGKLSQVLINLLGNAVKFTEEGTIVVRVSRADGSFSPAPIKENASSMVLFEVEDTGLGMAPEEMENLFQPFEQTLGGKAKGGSGLGLTISREYARLMGCDLSARSEPGKGSVFSFFCRFGHGRPGMIEKAEKGRRVLGLAPNAGTKTVLVVDDKEESRRFVVQLLNLVGFRTSEAGNGKEALAVFEAEEPDLVLMDMRMPIMDGYTATRRLKETAAGSKTPVIAVSASALEEERDKILAAGADEVIRKPFRENELFEGIRRLLGVEYRHAEEKELPLTDQDPGKLASGDLKALPEDLRQDLRQALIALDVDAIRELIERVGTFNRAAGKAMERLEREYQYDTLLDLLEG